MKWADLTPFSKAEVSATIIDAMLVRGSLRRAFAHGPVSDSATDDEPDQVIPDHWPSYWQWLRWIKLPEAVEVVKAYRLGREILFDTLEDRILDVADDGSNDTYIDAKGTKRTDHDVVNRSKLRVDTYKWLLAKMRPERFGDKLDLTSKGDRLPGVLYLPKEREGEA